MLALLGANAVQAGANFDEGVYLQAVGLFAEGRLPYDDFVLVHPPGALLLGWPLAVLAHPALGWDGVLTLGRCTGVLVGVANVFLVAAVTSRWRGRAAGLVAAALYASFVPAVAVESHYLLEPFVNLFVLSGALLWLGPREPSTTRAVGAGAVFGLATLVKLTGGLALVAVLASGWSWRLRCIACGAAALLWFGVTLPFGLVAGGGRLFDLLIRVQLTRPGGDVAGGSIDGIVARLGATMRFGLLGPESAPVTLRVAAAGVVVVIVGCSLLAGGRQGRFWGAWVAASWLLILRSPDFYEQYPVPLGSGIAVLGGATAAAVTQRLRGSTRRGVAAAVATVSALGLMTAVAHAYRGRSTSPVDVKALVAEKVPPGECLFSTKPALALAAGRLLQPDRSGTVLVDPFGGLLTEALADASPSTTLVALRSAPAQRRIRQALDACPWVLLGSVPELEPGFSEATTTSFRGHYALAGGSRQGPGLWHRIHPAP